MTKQNTFKARQERAKELMAEVAAQVTEAKTDDGVGQTGGPKPEAAQGGAIQFNIDQLFAALGAKDFECSMLRAEVQRLNQVVQTYKNIVLKQE